MSEPLSVVVRFSLLVALGFYLPGRALTPRTPSRLDALVTALVAGTTVAGLLWAGALLAGLDPRWAAGALAALAFFGLRKDLGSSLRESLVLPGIVVALCTASVGWTQFGNGLSRPDSGLVFFSTYPPEALFHCSLSQELRHSLPMQFPAGLYFSYHVLYNLIAALTAELTGGSMIDVHYRLLPLLFVPLTALAAMSFARTLGASRTSAAVGALFLFFADDLSWMAASLGTGGADRTGGPEWNLLLATPILYGLHHNRAFLAGLGALFVALSLSARYVREGRWGVLGIASLLAAATMQYKISFGLLLLAALAGTAMIAPMARGEPSRRVFVRASALLATSTLLAVPLAAFTLSGFQARESPLSFFPGYPILLTLLRTGIFSDWQSIQQRLAESPLLFVAVWGPLGGGLYTLGTLGVRVLGVVPLWKQCRAGQVPALLAATVIVAGLAVSLLFVPTMARENTVYFWGTSLCLLSVLAGVQTADVLQRTSRTGRLALSIVLVVLGLTGTVQMHHVDGSFHADPYLRVPPAEITAAAVLAERSRPGDVLLDPRTDYSFFSAVVPVRPVVAWPHWLRNLLAAEPLRARMSDVRTFFRENDSEKMREVLRRYDVSWVWVPSDVSLASSPPLPELRPELSTEGGTLYRVRWS